MIVSIQNAQYLGAYKIRLQFSDKTERTIDFSSFLHQSKNPMTRKYLNEDKFRDFNIQYGDIVWNDYELCFPIWDLYRGDVMKFGESVVVKD